jgi:hypothetical protein
MSSHRSMSTDPPVHLQKNGRTALDVAVEEGPAEMARVIRAGGGYFSRVGGVLELAHALLHAPYT